MPILNFTPIQSRIFKYSVVILFAAAVCFIAIFFGSFDGCNKEVKQDVVVLRDSADQKKIDSLQSVTYSQKLYIADLEKGITDIQSEQKFQKRIQKIKYEEIKNSNVDSAYRDVKQFLSTYSPED
ncbi:hypothetical protein D4R99_05240 [bacterium]|nr:MAG: hypothetical protein D4R99_05240 [bacterium]